MKHVIRKKILKLRKDHAIFDKYKKDKAILNRLAKFKIFRDSKEFFTYLSHKGEVSTDLLIDKFFGKKKIIVPKVRNSKICLFELKDKYQFEKGRFGIREPKVCLPKKNWKEIDIAIIPGIAFDKSGHRIGFGRGYFDKFLKKLHCTTIGLAYELQIIDKVPAQPYDVPVEYIITERRLIKCF